MLSTVGKIFFEVATISRVQGESIPTIYLNIRNTDTGKMIGQMRFNKDPLYSVKDIRMSFNMMNSEFINPETMAGGELLEELVVGGLLWISKDNHYLIPKYVCPYMMVHDYDEDNARTNLINGKIRSILAEYGCTEEAKNVFRFNPLSIGGARLSAFLKKKQQC